MRNMVQVPKKDFQSYMLVGFILLLVYLSFLVVNGILSAIIWAGVFAYIFKPFYNRLEKRLKNKTVAALLVCFIVVFAVFLPLIPLVTLLVDQIVSSFGYIAGGDFLNSLQNVFTSDVNLNVHLQDSLAKLVQYFVDKISDFVLTIPAKLVTFFVFLFLFFYLIKDGEKLVKELKSFLPIPKIYKDRLFRETSIGTKAILYGVVVSALAQGLSGTIGLIVVGTPNAIFWGVVMTFFSLIPFIGAWLVWLPISIWLVINGYQFGGIALLLYGTLFVSSIDNIVKSKIIGTKTQIHPGIIFVGLVGGLQVFGLVGIIVGPLVLTILISTLKLYRDNTQN